MSEPRPERQHRQLECDDCHATPDTGESHVIGVGRHGITETWHTGDCPQHTVERILMEDSARRVHEEDEQARIEFPAAVDRLKAAAAALPEDGPAAPFVAALLELVEAQGRDMGRFVTLPQWTEILQRRFPSAGA